MDLAPYLERLATGSDLSADEAKAAITHILSGTQSDAQIAAFLFAMRQKGETIDEMKSFVEVMRAASVKVDVDTSGAVDVCGTGGDKSKTFNISTAVMFVVAGAGVPVLKHGNRSVSSKSGSVDVLEALGVHALLHKNEVEHCFKETGMAFMFAPFFHPAMKHVMPARKQLNTRTFFNVLGPLLNPAGVQRQLVGAFDASTAAMMAELLTQLDTKNSATVHAMDGLDEISVTAPSQVFYCSSDSSVKQVQFSPEELRLPRFSLSDLAGDDATTNAAIIERILQHKGTQAQHQVVVLNAAFALHLAEKTTSIDEAYRLADETIQSGLAWKKLQEFAECTQTLHHAMEKV